MSFFAVIFYGFAEDFVTATRETACRVRRKDGKEHRSWSIVESRRVGHSTIPRHVLSLGEINDSQRAAWQKLVFVEEAFRTLTGDLGLRSICHHKPERIEAHLSVAFLAYCLSITFRQRLKALAGGLMPRVVFEKLAALQLLAVRIPTTDGRELLLVRRTEPDRDVALLLARLNLQLPPQSPPRISQPQVN